MAEILVTSKKEHWKAVSKWLLPCLQGVSPVFGNITENSIIATVAESEKGTPYLDRSYPFWITYNIQVFKSVADDFALWTESDIENSENLLDFGSVQAIYEWVSQQEFLRNYPQVETWVTDMVETPTVTPNYSGTDYTQDVNLAQYIATIRVHYTGVM